MNSVHDTVVPFRRSRLPQRVFLPLIKDMDERARNYAASLNKAASEQFDNRDLPSAYALLSRAVTIRPDCAVTAFNLGLTLQNDTKIAEAAFWYQRAISLSDGNPQAHFNLGFCLRSLGRKDESEAAFRAGLLLDPRRSDILLVVGISSNERGDHAAAASAFSRALALDPDNATLHAYLGTTLKDLGDPRGAIAELRRALDIDPRLDYARINLVWAMRCLRDAAPRPSHSLTVQVFKPASV